VRQTLDEPVCSDLALKVLLARLSKATVGLPHDKIFSKREGVMRTHTISVLVASFVFALASLLPAPAQAQADSVQPAVQDSSSKPIGKVVTVTGSVTIEHASAVVVQANVSGQASQTKVGDVVY
jgi:hypothetical protein